MSNRQSLSIVLGAGFSQALGIPGTVAIGKAIDMTLSSRPSAFAYTSLRDRLSQRFGASYNFETLMAALESCFVYGYPGLASVTPSYHSVLPEISKLREDLSPEVADELYEDAIATVVQQVSIDWTTLISVEKRQLMQETFTQLGGRYQLNIATLNYDQGAETLIQGCVDGFVGQAEYQYFDYAAFIADDFAPRIAHLHGGIAYGIIGPPMQFVKNTGPLSPRRTPLRTPRIDGSLWTAVVTGVDKPNKLVLPPYNFYFAWLANTLLQTPKIIVVGYGIGDVHVNTWLASAARHHDVADFRMIIIDRFEEKTAPPNLDLFAHAAGFEALSESALKDLEFEDGIAKHNGAMLVRTGMPLSPSQLTTVLHFLDEPRRL